MSQMANFEDLTSMPYTVVGANKTDFVSCNPSSFEGVDPLPDSEKECYCDSRKNGTSEEEVKQVIQGWRDKLEEEAAAEA